MTDANEVLDAYDGLKQGTDLSLPIAVVTNQLQDSTVLLLDGSTDTSQSTLKDLGIKNEFNQVSENN